MQSASFMDDHRGTSRNDICERLLDTAADRHNIDFCNQMNIIYDISILGEGFDREASRTGVFRVVENMLKLLVESGRFKILMYPAKMNYWECLEYLKKSGRPTACFYTPKFLSAHLLCGKSIHYLERFACNSAISLVKRLPVRIVLKIVRTIYNFFQLCSDALERNAKRRIIAEYDIYHTFLRPVPKWIKGIQTLKTFVTVFDLIPVIHPEYFNKKSSAIFKKEMEQLGADDYIISISGSTKEDLCCHYKVLDPKRIYVTHLAAPDTFRPCESPDRIQEVKRKLNIPCNARYVLSVATFEPRKNLDVIVKSFRKVLSSGQISDLFLVLAGPIGWKCEEVLDMVHDSSHVSGRIIAPGYVSDEDLRILYSDALVFVYPSRYEGFGLPPLEAMQCGAPVITSNTSSMPEVVSDAAIMVDPFDITTIANSILTFYHDNGLRAEMSRKSLDRARHFSWNNTVEKTIDAYKAALSVKYKRDNMLDAEVSYAGEKLSATRSHDLHPSIARP
ncbi:MAG TPA: glycosyltransferase family 1 protein [Syntrophorhabdaceae bacterium]|nr:glycosyltransferase family 1 protein [Syntrophorhabdaceae bacterium]